VFQDLIGELLASVVDSLLPLENQLPNHDTSGTTLTTASAYPVVILGPPGHDVNWDECVSVIHTTVWSYGGKEELHPQRGYILDGWRGSALTSLPSAHRRERVV
jgi:hypothetical protein